MYRKGTKKSYSRSNGATNSKLRQKVSEFMRKSKGYQFTAQEQRLINDVKNSAYSGGVVSKDKYMKFVRMCNRMK